MRISDWSSDVCSSDLMKLTVKVTRDGKTFEMSFLPRGKPMTVYQWELPSDPAALQANHCRASGQADMSCEAVCEKAKERFRRRSRPQIGREECRDRCDSTCRSRWSPSN